MKKLLPLLILCMSSLWLHAQSPEREIWTLRECLEYAKQSNLALQIAELNLQSNDVALQRARMARMPNLNASSNFRADFGYAINPFTNEFTSAGNQSLNLGLSSNVTLYDGGRISRSIRQAEVDKRVSELDLKQAEYDLALNITLAYLDILRNQELVRMADLQVEATTEQRERTNKLVEAGAAPRADLLQIESQIATDQLSVVNAQNNLETAFLILMQLLQLNPGQRFGVQEINVEVPESDLFASQVQEIYQEAEANQPIVQSADLQVRSSELGVDIARSGMLPSLSAGASFGTGWASGRQRTTGQTAIITDTSDVAIQFGGEFQDVSVISEFEQPIRETYSFQDQLSDNISASVFVSLSIPIYNRFQNSANIQQNEINRDRSHLQAQQTRQQLAQDIQAAYVQASSAYSTYQSTNKQIDALQLTFDNTDKQYNLGVVNSLDYLIAKNNLERAKNDLVQAKYNYIFRLKVLDFYRGRPIGF